MSKEELIAQCAAINASFHHIRVPDGTGVLLSSSAEIRGQRRVFETPIPGERMPRIDAIEAYHLGECLKALERAADGSPLAPHRPGAPAAEDVPPPES